MQCGVPRNIALKILGFLIDSVSETDLHAKVGSVNCKSFIFKGPR
jgi:hypothetical protein